MSDILITLPKSVKWPRYQLELKAAAAGQALSFKVAQLPVNARPGDKCWVTHQGRLKGHMPISALLRNAKLEDGSTGNLIQHQGRFIPAPYALPTPPFQGVRYLKLYARHMAEALMDLVWLPADGLVDVDHEAWMRQAHALSTTRPGRQLSAKDERNWCSGVKLSRNYLSTLTAEGLLQMLGVAA